MDELEIDRTLRAALSEDPSPDFVARVRTTLAEAPRPSMVAGWVKPGAIACAAAMLIAVWLPREEARQQEAQLKLSPTEQVLSPTEQVLSPREKAPAPVVVVVPTFRSAKSNNRSTRARAMARDPQFPEVIIAADDVEAIRQFVSGARDRRFVATFEEAPRPTAWVMNDLAIAPITVEPLDSTQSHNN